MQPIDDAFAKLARSRFRSRFHLDEKDRAYIEAKGMDTIRAHTADFVAGRLAPAHPANDGRQTPMRGHPAFKAMHSCACCCRGCLAKWHGIPEGRALTADEQAQIVDLLMTWIEREYDNRAE